MRGKKLIVTAMAAAALSLSGATGVVFAAAWTGVLTAGAESVLSASDSFVAEGGVLTGGFTAGA